jgi:hypothetical protein
MEATSAGQNATQALQDCFYRGLVAIVPRTSSSALHLQSGCRLVFRYSRPPRVESSIAGADFPTPRQTLNRFAIERGVLTRTSSNIAPRGSRGASRARTTLQNKNGNWASDGVTTEFSLLTLMSIRLQRSALVRYSVIIHKQIAQATGPRRGTIKCPNDVLAFGHQQRDRRLKFLFPVDFPLAW